MEVVCAYVGLWMRRCCVEVVCAYVGQCVRGLLCGGSVCICGSVSEGVIVWR